ncbi:Fic family protein [Mycolicibacterium sp. GF69]|uniref:Fic family protein n=1 Tax=Mycolicibacterium sp. GF69 TaxID=2267251 RepID=UPI000DCC5390|nr:Fic/DOC family N-terminal domain-containing protein [Mycolicibacterium sp. GF69]RAV10633.1 Fic family protein [Mycolicibacterium sp. GF69]
MDAALRESPIGEVVPIHGFDPRFNEEYDHFAYIPDDLPDLVVLEPITYAMVVDATAALARADQAAALLPNPSLLARPAIRREAVSTSALEGTFAALTDVFEADFLDPHQMSGSVSEVHNYVRAAETAYGWLSEGRPLSVSMLESLHELLVKGTRSDGPEAGHVRTTQVFIGAGRRRVTECRFVPPPPDDRLHSGLRQWEAWINAPHSSLSSIVRLALGHYQFEALHPFNDGNGRLGRLVCALQLQLYGNLQNPILNIAPWLERNREEYQGQLLSVSLTGVWDPWVQFICAAIQAEAIEVIGRVNRLHDIRERFKTVLADAGAKGVSLRIAEDLIGYPMITAQFASDVYGVSYPAANSAIQRLIQVGILRQRSEGNYSRIFACDAVLSALEG